MRIISKYFEPENEMIGDLVGEKIKKIRKERGIGQDEFGRKMGVTRQTVSAWEKNGSILTVAQILRIASVLKTPVTYFFRRQPVEVLPMSQLEDNCVRMSLALHDKKTYDLVESLIGIINDLTEDELSILIQIASTMAGKKQAAEEAYRKGFLNASIYCGIRDGESRDGYDDGQDEFEAELQKKREELLDNMIFDAEEQTERIENYYSDVELNNCSSQEACAIQEAVSNEIYDRDFHEGYSDAERNFEADCRDWDG